MIRCVMFDLGNVLVHFDTQRWYDFIATHQRNYSIKAGDCFNSDHGKKFDLGLISYLEYYEAVRRAYYLNIGIDVFFFEFTDIMMPDQKMIRLKRLLKQNGVKLALVSNINNYHFDYVAQRWPEVFADFDYLALSFQQKSIKPDDKMWRVSAAPLDAKEEECFFIDDRELNIAAFKRWGGGIGHHYNVVDDAFCPNGRLDIERRELVFRLASLGLISFSQAADII